VTGTASAPATSPASRDVGWVERTEPLLWPMLNAWFRPDIRGLDRIPAGGPVLLVGNHSGGNVAPDTLVLTAAFIRRFGAGRPFFQLAHRLVTAAPWLALLRRHRTVTASPENARAALQAGADPVEHLDQPELQLPELALELLPRHPGAGAVCAAECLLLLLRHRIHLASPRASRSTASARPSTTAATSADSSAPVSNRPPSTP